MVEEYVRRHGLRDILQRQMEDLLTEQPDDIYSFLKSWAENRGASTTGSSDLKPLRLDSRRASEDLLVSPVIHRVQSGDLNDPLSPFANRGMAPDMMRRPDLNPMPRAFSDIKLDGSQTLNAEEIKLDLDETRRESAGSPVFGADFDDLGRSCFTPRGKRSNTTAASAPTLEDNSDVFVESDAAGPLPIRRPDSSLFTFETKSFFRDITKDGDDRYTAVRTFDDARVCLKALDTRQCSKTDVDEMLAELYSVVNVSHRHPVFTRVLDGFVDRGAVYVVHEHLPTSVSLMEYVRTEGPLDEKKASHVMQQLIDGLHFLHFNGLPHRSIEWGNVFVVDTANVTVKLGMFELKPPAMRSNKDFEEDLRDVGEMMNMAVESDVLVGDFGELIDTMCDPDGDSTTATILAQIGKVPVKDVLSSTGIPLLEMDAHGNIVEINYPGEELFEYPSDELAGENMAKLMADDATRLNKGWMDDIESHLDQTFTMVAFTKGGERLSVEVRLARTAGNFLAIFRDVSPIQSLRMQFQMKELKLRIAEYIPLAMVRVDASNAIVECNRTAAEMFGYPPAALVGSSLSRLAPKERYLNQWCDGVALDSCNLVVCRGGSGLHMNARLSIFRSQLAGQVGHRVLFFLPELACNQDFGAILTTVADSMKNAVVIMDDLGLIQRFSSYAEHIFGWSEGDVLDKNVSILMDPSIGAHHQSFVEGFKKNGISYSLGRPRDVTGRTSTGEDVPLTISVHPYSRNGRQWFAGCITRSDKPISSTRRSVGRSVDLSSSVRRESNLASFLPN